MVYGEMEKNISGKDMVKKKGEKKKPEKSGFC